MPCSKQSFKHVVCNENTQNNYINRPCSLSVVMSVRGTLLLNATCCNAIRVNDPRF